jgi:hypothetical protein
VGTFDKNPILESIETLCQSSNPKVSFSKMCVDLGLSKSLNTKLKNNPTKTINMETAQKIADYFGVSVDRVLGSEQKENPTKQPLGEVIPSYSDLSPDNQKKVRDFIDALLTVQQNQ